MKNPTLVFIAVTGAFLLGASAPTLADDRCKALPDHAALTAALKKGVVVDDAKANGGLALNMWATVVARDGTVCAVTFTATTGVISGRGVG